MSGNILLRLEQSRLYDWAMRLPIVLYSFYVLIHDVLAFTAQVAEQPEVWAYADGGVIVAALARVSQWMFLLLLAVLPLFRHRPIAKSVTASMAFGSGPTAHCGCCRRIISFAL
jgi:hypothetical protein